jgi:hypothetical protein
MSQANLERLDELLARARAICELARVAAQDEMAERLRHQTLGSALLMVEDLLSQAMADLASCRVAQAHVRQGWGSKGSPPREEPGS